MKTINNLKNRSLVYFLFFLILFVTFWSCGEEIVNQPVNNSADDAKQVENIQVESLNGAAIIRYNVVDKATSYVLVEYETAPNILREQKASKYVDSLFLEGFSKAGTYSIKLYSVNSAEKRSEPVVMDVEILEIPLVLAYKTLQTRVDFGGINISIDNETEADFLIETLSTNEAGEITTIDTHYTSQKEISHTLRGFANEPKTFWVTMRDRWENRSDTTETTVTPLFEEDVPSNEINHTITLPTDFDADNSWNAWGSLSPRGEEFIFNNITAGSGNDVLMGTAFFPWHFTFKFPHPITLSRFKLWYRNFEPDLYRGNSPKRFELWGSLDPDLENGTYEGWSLIGSYEVIRPSGLGPNEPLTEEDDLVRKSGFEFPVPIDYGEVEYVRVRAIEAFVMDNQFAIGELKFYGKYN